MLSVVACKPRLPTARPSCSASAKRGEGSSRVARDKVDAALAEASSLAGLGAQSADTLSLLARDKTRELVKGSQEDVLRWQAAVVSSVESRVLEEFDAFVVELEPALRKSGRRTALEAMGFLGQKWSPTREVAEEARRVGDAEHLERLERFEKLVVQPVLTRSNGDSWSLSWRRRPSRWASFAGTPRDV